MSRKPPFLVIIALVCFVATQLSGCGTSQTSNYSEGRARGSVNVIALNSETKIQTDPKHVAVVGRIRIEDKHGTPLNTNTEPAIYTLRDFSPDARIPDLPLAKLIRLGIRPFAPDKDGYVQVVLPKGRYYFYFVYRHQDLGFLAINPHVRIDVSTESQVVYLGTLKVTIDLERVGGMIKDGTTSHPSIDGPLRISVSDEFAQDSQQLLGRIQDTAGLSVEPKMFVLDPSKEPSFSSSKNQKAGVFNENRTTEEILKESAALLLLAPFVVIFGGSWLP